MSLESYSADNYDASNFGQEGYSRKVDKPWGYEIHWVPEDLPYMGKILFIEKGKRLSLQAHDTKRESWLLMSGDAKVVWDNMDGELTETELEPGQGFTCAVGQRHRLCGITDCHIIEVSTPEEGNTWRLEDDFRRPDETPEQRFIEREGM